MALDAYFEVSGELVDARETREALSADRSDARFDSARFCWDGDMLRVMATNAGDARIDALNVSILVDGVVVTGFVPDVDGEAPRGNWDPGLPATFNRTGIAAEPERVTFFTAEGARAYAEKTTCPVLRTIVVTPSSVGMDIGETRTFSAVGYDQFGVVFDGSPYTFTSGCGTVAQIDTWRATFTAGTVSGACVLTATSGDVSGTATITIDPDTPATIVVANDPTGVAAGGTASFAATAYDQYGNVNTSAPVAWSTNAGAISGAGVLTAQTTAQVGLSVTATTTGAVTGSATVDVYADAPQSAIVSPDPVDVVAGQTQAFSVVLTDAYGNVNATAVVVWTTDAGAIDASGVLTAQTLAQNGRSVTATSGAASDTATVNVLPDAPDSIAITPDGAGVPAGGTQAYSAVVYDQYGNVNPTAVSWSTNAGAIDASGVLTAQTLAANGKTVTATAGAATQGATVDVWPAAPATALVTPDGAGVPAGATQAYSVTLYDVYGNVNATAPVTWTTNAGSISGAGVLTAQTTAANGKSVTATSGAASDSATVDVWPNAPASVTVTPEGAGVTAGGTQAYAAVVYDAYGNVNTTASVTWSTNAGSISGVGVLTAQTTAASGKTVTAFAGGVSDQVFVDIIAAAPSSVTVSPNVAGVAAGGTATFSATVRDAYGNVNGTAGVTWTTNAGSISAGGVLTAQTTPQLGRSVTATTTGGVSASATVDVYAAAPASVTLSPTSAIVNTTLTQQFTATVRDAYGNVNTTSTVSWSATRGSVSASGLYTAPATTGADTVTATSGSASGGATISVQRAIHITTMVTYKNNVTASSFTKATDTVEVRTTIVDHLGNAVSGATVTMQWIRPNTNLDHTDTLTTAADGTARAYMLAANPPGTWTARVTAISGTDLWHNTAADVTTTVTFTVA